MRQVTLNSVQEFQNFQNTANAVKEWFDYKMQNCNNFIVTAKDSFLKSIGY